MTSGFWGGWTAWCGRRRFRAGSTGRGSGIRFTCCSTKLGRGSQWLSSAPMGWRTPSVERLGARLVASRPHGGGSPGGWTPRGRMSEGSASRSAARCCRGESWNHPGRFPASSRDAWSASPRSRPTRPRGLNPRERAWVGRGRFRTDAGRNWSCAWNSRAPLRPRGGASCHPRGAVRRNGGIRPLRKTGVELRGALRRGGRVPITRPSSPGTGRALTLCRTRAQARTSAAPGGSGSLSPFRWRGSTAMVRRPCG